jgi:isoquinoline 1-oxidoreductase beta subunit
VFDHPYAFPSIETFYVEVDVPVPIGPWRSVFSPPSVFARESFLDEMALAMGRDPVELRLSLLRTDEKIVERGRMKIDRSRLARVIEVVRDKSAWGAKLPKGKGRGIAANTYHGNTHIAHVAEVETGSDGRIRVTRIVAAVDCGVAVNPLGIEAQIESGVVWALSMALKGHMEWKNGAGVAENFLDHDVLRLYETPVIETHIVQGDAETPFGMGEPTVCPVVPAVANAIFAATGQRLRRLPFKLEVPQA